MKRMRQALALLLSVAMLTALTACGGGGDQKSNEGGNEGDSNANTTQEEGNETADNEEDNSTEKESGSTGTYDTLVIGVQPLDGVFSPFFYQSAYDDQVNSLIFESICELNPDGELVDNCGHVEVKEEKAEDGSTKYVYTVSIKEGMTFSDGEAITIDDVLFTYYVYADPSYDGMSTFATLDIDGMADYVNSEKPLWKAISEAGKENTDFTNWTEEQQTKFWEDLDVAGAAFAQEIVDAVIAGQEEGAENPIQEGDVKGAAASWGFELADGATTLDFFNAMVEQYQGDLATLSDTETAGSSLADLLGEAYTQMVALSDVNEIRGIQKVDDYTCTITFNSPNISADKQVAWTSIMPEHYYGAGFSKGNLDSVKEKNTAPLGSGAYVFESYDNNIVSLTANPNYWAGEPKIPNIKVQTVNEEDKVDLVLNGEIDVTDPSASTEIIEQLEAETDKASYTLVDNPGYGYIGINAERVPDLNVRKGLMHLMNRAPAISSYYGELGAVVERPMTPTLAEYPDDATEYYGYDPAKALEYFKAAGYEEKDGKLVKDGEQLTITVGIGDSATHPSTPILTQMANDMEAMGAQLVVNDMQFNILNTEVTGGNLDMWVMAWGNATDCDLTQIFGSKGGSNYQRYSDPKIDAIQAEILKTIDFDERCKLVAEELDMIMEAAVYMPVYQRKNMEIYNATTMNLDTLPEETTTYYNYSKEIETLEMQ